ncbi:MAG: ABC transporter substrate-binding protein [Clostridiales bacterium]|nr:ABC transporter substrate-binding protein [Clostridiales bacterium]
MKFKKIIGLVLVFSLIAVVISGCGKQKTTSKELDKITVQSLWLPQGQFAGLYVADSKGFYEEEGIDVEILPGGTDVSSEEQVENDVAQVGVAFYSSVLTYQEGGYDFINVFQTFQTSPQYLVAKASSGIKTGADLKGKNVGSWFGGRQYEFYALAQLNGLDPEKDIKWKQQDYTLDQFNSGELDVASAMSYNEYLLLLQTYQESDLNVIDMNKEGAALLEDCLFVKRSWAEQNKDLLVRFLRATIKGWKYTSENPEEAAQIVYNIGQNSTLDHQVAMTKKVLETVIPEGNNASQIGYLNPTSIQRTIDLGYQSGLTKNKIDISKSVDSSYWEAAVK